MVEPTVSTPRFPANPAALPVASITSISPEAGQPPNVSWRGSSQIAGLRQRQSHYLQHAIPELARAHVSFGRVSSYPRIYSARGQSQSPRGSCARTSRRPVRKVNESTVLMRAELMGEASFRTHP